MEWKWIDETKMGATATITAMHQPIPPLLRDLRHVQHRVQCGFLISLSRRMVCKAEAMGSGSR